MPDHAVRTEIRVLTAAHIARLEPRRHPPDMAPRVGMSSDGENARRSILGRRDAQKEREAVAGDEQRRSRRPSKELVQGKHKPDGHGAIASRCAKRAWRTGSESARMTMRIA